MHTTYLSASPVGGRGCPLPVVMLVTKTFQFIIEISILFFFIFVYFLKLASVAGFEPTYASFGDLCLNHLTTPTDS